MVGTVNSAAETVVENDARGHWSPWRRFLRTLANGLSHLAPEDCVYWPWIGGMAGHILAHDVRRVLRNFAAVAESILQLHTNNVFLKVWYLPVRLSASNLSVRKSIL